MNIGRIEDNRAHLDDGVFVPEFDDFPDRGVGGKWTDVNPEIVELTVNGAKRQQFKLCQTELEQVKAQCKKVFGTENPSRNDILNYILGHTQACSSSSSGVSDGIIGSSYCSWRPIVG